MSRVLVDAPLEASPYALGVPPAALDVRTTALVEEAAAEAYERGRREGFEDGSARARAEAARATGAIVEALRAATQQLEALESVAAEGDVALATAIAEAVLGRTPHDGGAALLDRLREALALLDDRPLVVRVAHADAAALDAGLGSVPGISVEPDAALAPGEARVVGAWGTADLTRAAAWDALRTVLDAEEATDAEEAADVAA